MAVIDELGRHRGAAQGYPEAGFPSVSVVVPMRNEAAHIGRCLDALARQEYASGLLEVLAVDGASTDGTTDVVRSRLPGARVAVRLLENPGVTAARGLNVGIRAARGDVIIILGAHSEPALDFVRASVEALWRSEADCVGGRIESVARGAVGEAIALAMASRFGVGDVRFRTSDTPGFVDTVAFGAYKRDVFDRIGLFDEFLDRNVDDEFNYRLRDAGGTLYLDPSIRSRYYTRQTFGDLFRQYRHYGEWKVVVAQRHPAQMRPRHFVPAAFVGATVLGLLAYPLGLRAPLNRGAERLHRWRYSGGGRGGAAQRPPRGCSADAPGVRLPSLRLRHRVLAGAVAVPPPAAAGGNGADTRALAVEGEAAHRWMRRAACAMSTPAGRRRGATASAATRTSIRPTST